MTRDNPTASRGGRNRGRRIAVVGGGLGGLAAALAFAQRGARVEVFERAPEIAEVGAGIQVSPNGARVLAALGLDGAAAERSVAVQAVEPMDAVTGRSLTRFDLSGRPGPAYRFFHRAALIDILLKGCSAAGVTLHTGAEITPDALPAADLVVGGDGIRSVLRPLLNGADTAEFTGQVAWRAVIDHPGAAPVARVWTAPGQHAVTYPLPGGRLNIVAVQERRQWAKEGWNIPDDPGNLRHAFRGLSGRLTGLLEQVDAVGLWGLFRHPVADHWHTDTIAILGDAAHPTLPFLAQGANLAFEDAWALAACCDGDEIAAALPRYQQMRRARVQRAIAVANGNAVKYHLSGLPRRAAHLGLRGIGALSPNAYLNRLNWLYDHDVTRA
ncbi:FAD-dependent monooxygenase [Salibaculum halophilum]|uniref:FAD-dependent monooxygenase n=1 Tax=Salibaculum halophilum TaxID=1914408 RepID=UPI001FE41664|nr:FAD-dependent monooxygenase [Salibaculum halophilum]